MIEKYTKYASFFSILFFVGAAWFEYLYYRSFGIEIFTYISVSEIISLFIGYIPMLLGIAALLIFLIFVFSEIFRESIQKYSYNPRHTRERRLQLRMKSIRMAMIVFMIYFLVVFGPTIFTMRRFIYSEGYFMIKALANFVLLFWVLVPILVTTTTLSKGRIYLVLFIAVFYVTIYFLSTYQLWAIKNDSANNTQLSVVFKDSTSLSTSDSVIYIGRTNTHIFFYYPDERAMHPHTSVINLDEVKNIMIYRNVSGFRIP